MRLIGSLVNLVLSLYSVAIVVYVILSWVKPVANRWTELLRSIVEPVLAPIRRLLQQHLPNQWQVVDWSPLAALLLVRILKSLFSAIFSF